LVLCPSRQLSTVAARMPAIIFLERFEFCPPINFF